MMNLHTSYRTIEADNLVSSTSRGNVRLVSQEEDVNTTTRKDVSSTARSVDANTRGTANSNTLHSVKVPD